MPSRPANGRTTPKKKAAATRKAAASRVVVDPFEVPQVEGEATEASEWQSSYNEGFLVTLPSGNKARVRRTMDLVPMLKAGLIPNPLASVIRRMIERKEFVPDATEFTPDALAQLLEFIDDTTCRVMVSPQVMRCPEDEDPRVWTPPPGAVRIEAVDFQDKMFLLRLSQGGAADLSSFRNESAQAMADISDGLGVVDSSKSTARAR